MSSKGAFLTGLIIFLAPAFLALVIKLTPSSFQPSLDRTQKVYTGFALNQSFVSLEDRLSGIGVSIKNPNLINQKDIKVSLYEGEQKLREVTLNGRAIGDGNFVKFIFAPVMDSQGKQYKFVFSADEAKAEEALEIFLTEKSPKGDLYVNNEKINGGLSSVEFHRPQNQLFLIFSIYQKWLGKLSTDLPFFVFYSFIWLFGLGYLLKETLLQKKIS